MRANHSDHRLYETYSLDSKSKNDNTSQDQDRISFKSLDFEQNPGLYYLSPNSNPKPHRRRLSNITKRSTNIDLNGNGIYINGKLFDEQLFQSPSSSSSYILDYKETPKDLNKFIEGHHSNNNNHQTKVSHLDLHLFKLSFIMTLSDWNVDKELLLDHYPNDHDNKNLLEEISHYKKFCFPELNPKDKSCGTLIEETSTYIFTRTNSNGQVEYGYCRRVTHENSITPFPVVICIVSTYSYFKLYDAILQELTKVYESNELECSLLMQSFYSKLMPMPTSNSSSGIVCKLNNRRVFFYVCPHDERLNHDYFSTLLSCLSPSHIVHLFESMLRSKKILCFSNSLTKLTKCCLALSHIIYPFQWPYSFVSLMPSSWVHDLVDSPCPYIYGCLYETMKYIPQTLEKDSIHVDLDLNTIDIGLNDGFILPLDLRQTLNSSFEYLIRFRLSRTNINLINIAFSEACLNVFIELFHRLPDFFKREDNDGINEKSSKTDCQSSKSNDTEKRKGSTKQEDYEFRSDEFLILQPTPAYVNFLNDFIRGMILLKFLDDYQRSDNNSKQIFALFNQRIHERRRMTMDELAVNPVIRFRQTFDLLEKQMKHTTKSTNPILSRIAKKFFE